MQNLGDGAGQKVPCFGTRLDLRLAMLQYPLRTGPTAELIWFVAEANALRRVRPEASFAVRSQLIAETRRWVVRDLRAERESTGRKGTCQRQGGPGRVADAFWRVRGSSPGSDDDWEGFTLPALWRVCCDGVRDLPQFTSPPPPAIRHRDLLLEATGDDTDALVHSLLIPFCAAFLDQGLARWQLPRRDEGFLRRFRACTAKPGGSPSDGDGAWPRRCGGSKTKCAGPLESIYESLEALGVATDRMGAFSRSNAAGPARMGRNDSPGRAARGDRVVRPISERKLSSSSWLFG